MDIVSHGLWGGVLFGRANRSFFGLAVLFGMLPDLMSFGVFTVASFLGLSTRPDWGQQPSMDMIPQYVHTLYDISHSLITFAVIFGLIWIIRRKPFWPLAAYGVAVAYDIPTHSAEFFPTPFLWPLSEFKVDGVSWGQPAIFFPNLGALVAAYVVWWGWSRWNKNKKK